MVTEKVKHPNYQLETFGWILPAAGKKLQIPLFKFQRDAERAAEAAGRPKWDVIPVVITACKPTEEHLRGY